ncbi:hypothetical protein JKP88DRAFT_331492 [Tribonema minus]|uniref:Uncharacterized protein n=1 Tax=Tribonema minus TaxID=303371 RepID=A0A835YM31_9STRA|nr:hypothetical protein JKP88DRAFT_331492 [Tribonema minus]
MPSLSVDPSTISGVLCVAVCGLQSADGALIAACRLAAWHTVAAQAPLQGPATCDMAPSRAAIAASSVLKVDAWIRLALSPPCGSISGSLRHVQESKDERVVRHDLLPAVRESLVRRAVQNGCNKLSIMGTSSQYFNRFCSQLQPFFSVGRKFKQSVKAMAAVAEAMDRARHPAPAAPSSHDDILRMVLLNMAGRRLLPKEAWSLSRSVHDSAAPTVQVRLVADSAAFAIPHRLLDDTARRLVVKLTMEGDFSSIQDRPLSLPASLVRLELHGFRGELGPAPAGLRELFLCACRDQGIHHPLLEVLADEYNVLQFLHETAEMVGSMLPTLRVLHVDGLNLRHDLRACMQVLCELPHPYLEDLTLSNFKLHLEDLLSLLSPPVAMVNMVYCSLESDAVSSRFTMPTFPEGLISLSVKDCYFAREGLVLSRLPNSLRHIIVESSSEDVDIELPLPTLLESLSLAATRNSESFNITAGMLPAGLQSLELAGSRHAQLDEMPPGLRVLKLRSHEHLLPPFPDTLETLVLDNCTHQIADIPDSVQSLSLYWSQDPPALQLPVPTRWPACLEHLVYWGTRTHQDRRPRVERLPPTLRWLELNCCEIHADLPQTLQELRLGREFNQPLHLEQFTGRFVVNTHARDHPFRDFDIFVPPLFDQQNTLGGMK